MHLIVFYFTIHYVDSNFEMNANNINFIEMIIISIEHIWIKNKQFKIVSKEIFFGLIVSLINLFYFI